MLNLGHGVGMKDADKYLGNRIKSTCSIIRCRRVKIILERSQRFY